jgi:hypothetical protein
MLDTRCWLLDAYHYDYERSEAIGRGSRRVRAKMPSSDEDDLIEVKFRETLPDRPSPLERDKRVRPQKQNNYII